MVKKPSACHVGVGSCVAEASKPANTIDADTSYSLRGLSDQSSKFLRLMRKCLHLGHRIAVLNC